MNDLILLIEDDIEFGETVRDYFTSNGLSVIWAKDGETGVHFFKNTNTRLVLLDVQLPDIDGFRVANEILKINNNIPLIFMTGTALTEEDFTNAYQNLYAKNYLEKPIKLPVALAMIKSILYPPSTKIYSIKNIQIKIDGQQVSIDNQEFTLRDKEIQVLLVLLDNLNHTVNRNNILREVWKGDDLYLYTTLNTCISRIKKELKNFPFIKLRTIYGRGYKLLI